MEGLLQALLYAALLVLFLVVLGVLAAGRYEAYLGGLWVGDPAFLAQAKLRDMQLFLAPGGSPRQGYLVMTDLDGRFLANQAFELRVGHPVGRWRSALCSLFRTERDQYVARSAEFCFDSAPPIPEELHLSLSLLDGSLALYDDSKLYAFLEKDHAASAAALAAYQAPS
jgi:hypothetical protein